MNYDREFCNYYITVAHSLITLERALKTYTNEGQNS
jgi:hypothetical protein